MKHNPKRLLAFLLTGLLLLGVTGCAGGGGSGARLMVWSASEDQSKDSGQWLQTCCEKFAEMHPEWNLTFVYGVADEATAANTVSQDPEASADVFLYANDNLTVLTNAKALAKIGGKYADEVASFTSGALLDSVTLDGYLYGVPFTTNTWYMYYDKRVFTEEDVKSLEAMLDKGVVSFPFLNSWYLPSFYFGNGCTLFGDGTQEELGADFGGENAAEVTDYLIDLLANPHFVVDDGGAGIGFQVAKGFFDTTPYAIDEAAMLDGCTRWQIFTKITLPLSKPIVIYTILTSFIAPWVDFIFAKVICRANADQYTVAIGLWRMLEKEYIDNWYTCFAAGAVLISIPIALLFLKLQKYYVNGTGGAVKG